MPENRPKVPPDKHENTSFNYTLITEISQFIRESDSDALIDLVYSSRQNDYSDESQICEIFPAILHPLVLISVIIIVIIEYFVIFPN